MLLITPQRHLYVWNYSCVCSLSTGSLPEAAIPLYLCLRYQNRFYTAAAVNKNCKQNLGLKGSAWKRPWFDFVFERGRIFFGGGRGWGWLNLSKPFYHWLFNTLYFYCEAQWKWLVLISEYYHPPTRNSFKSSTLACYYELRCPQHEDDFKIKTT